MFNEEKSVCFGRMIIEVPATAIVIHGYAEVHWKIERLAGEAEKMQSWINRRLEEIEEEKIYAHKNLKHGPEAMYGKIVDGALPMQKLVFGVDRGAGIFYRIESFFRLGSDLFIQEAMARTSKQIEEDGGGGSINEVIAELNATAKKIRSRVEGEVFEDVGVCVDGAFIAKPLGEAGENFAIGFRFKEFPDVHFSINTRVSIGGAQQDIIDGVQRRQKDAERNARHGGYGAWYSGIKFLRRGEREFNGGKGYEFLVRKPAQGGGAENHQFVFEGGGEVNNELRPAFKIQMDTGAGDRHTARVPPSLTDEEAVALWDRLVSSIRIRPTGGAKTSQSQLPKVSLGTLHVTGHRCPQTGWWECADELTLAQPSGIWLEQGQLMPKARIWAQPNWWDRLKGERPVGWTAAVWRLAGYEKPQAPGGGQAG
jgi:hypothetical protein